MSTELWTEVDRHIVERVVKPDDALRAARETSAAAGLPSIEVSPPQGALLTVLALAKGARRILEIGTLGGYSAIWLARGLPPDGCLMTLEANPQHAAVARANLARAGLTERVELREGRGVDLLARMAEGGEESFDLVFIDADKPSYVEYFEGALKLARVGTLIIADNVVRRGGIVDPNSEDANVQGAQRFIERLGAEPRVTATIIQTVGSKGHDGLALAVVTSED
jgi:predicted O-methyltransferase YrrM